MTEEVLDADALSADEQAYFDSKGEKEIVPPINADEPEPINPDEPDADEAAKAEIEGRPKEQKKVPLAALTESRAETKEFKAKLAEIEKRSAVLEDRWNTMLKLGEQAEQPKPEAQEDLEPDRDQDIFAHNAWLSRQQVKLNERLEGLAKDQSERAAQLHQERAEKAVWDYWDAATAEYKATKTDFGDAAQWLAETRSKQLAALGVVDARFKNPQAINAQINEELKQIVVAAAQQKISPAEAVYNLATQWGYTPKQAEEAAAAAGDDIEKVAKAVEGATSLSGAGGSRPGAVKDASDIANMSATEFEAWFAKNGASGFRKLAGG